MPRAIPPEQQAEAEELDAALSELNGIYTQEYQEMVRSDERMFKILVLWDLVGWKESLSFQYAKNDSIAERKTLLAEKSQKLVRQINI